MQSKQIISKISEYFRDPADQGSVVIECPTASLLNMEICMLESNVSFDGKNIQSVVEPTICFPNDSAEYHIHFDNYDELIEFCNGIINENIVFEIHKDKDMLLQAVNLNDINDRELYKRILFYKPKWFSKIVSKLL
jgi:hypothetical protein